MGKKIELTEEDYNKLCNEKYSKFTSTMIDIVRERTGKINPNEILKNYEQKYNYYKPAPNDAIIYNEMENIFYKSVSNDYDCIELSPINPIGTNSILTPLSQDMSLSTIRNAEVISDSSTALALEAAYIRKQKIKELKVYNSLINLAASQRILRMQNYGNGKQSHWTQHFRAFSLVTSFRNNNDYMQKSVILQINNWLNTLKTLNKNGFEMEKITVNIAYLPLVMDILKNYNVDFNQVIKNSMNSNYDNFSDNNINLINNVSCENDLNHLDMNNNIEKYIILNYRYFEKEYLSELKKLHPDVNFNFQLNRKSGLNYYKDVAYEILVTNKDGITHCPVDGGITNWTSELLGDKKERCVASGMGTEHIARSYTK